jgi:hypothetical protein
MKDYSGGVKKGVKRGVKRGVKKGVKKVSISLHPSSKNYLRVSYPLKKLQRDFLFPFNW